MTSSLEVRPAGPEEMGLFAEWAAREGWNPGLADAECFREQDPEGFLIGRLNGEPAATISAVRYEGGYGFLGFYIVRPELRGQGHGLAIWRRAMERMEGTNAGLDGVLAQEENYRRSGFRREHRNARRAFQSPGGTVRDSTFVPAAEIPFMDLLEYDRRVFGFPRAAFLRRWITSPGVHALASVEGGKVRGYGVLRPCGQGFKIGPLFAGEADRAEALLLGLAGAVPEGSALFLDTPGCNAAADRIARRRGMETVFETVRMYTKGPPDFPAGEWFGVTTFELG